MIERRAQPAFTLSSLSPEPENFSRRPSTAPFVKNWKLKLSLYLNYFVFAMLLNSVGTVILQVQRNYGVSGSSASALEACKDLSIAVVSFLVASYVARIGYRRSMLVALGAISAMCAAMPLVPTFVMTKLLFIATGACFALIKVSVYATIGLITGNRKDHASFMSFLESFFMVGVLSGYFIFSAFTDNAQSPSTSWLRVYYVLAALTLVAFLLLATTRIDETVIRPPSAQPLRKDFSELFRLMWSSVVLVFIASVFFSVLVEQSIMSWLPSYNNSVLHLPTTLSIEIASILAASIALGRFIAGFVLHRFAWFPVLATCLIGAASLVLVALPLAHSSSGAVTSWSNAPLGAFVFPMIGLFLSPIYPVINSAVLTALPSPQHAAMSGLSVIFSALGGTTGSIVNGFVFDALGGQTAFYLSLIPIASLLIALYFFNRLQTRSLVRTIEAHA